MTTTQGIEKIKMMIRFKGCDTILPFFNPDKNALLEYGLEKNVIRYFIGNKAYEYMEIDNRYNGIAY